jgi:hypothetical protein
LINVEAKTMGFLERLLGGVTPSPPHGTNPNLCLYVIGFEDPQLNGIVKIGVTNNMAKRLQTLQTGCPWRLEVKAMVYRPDSFQFEGWLHDHFDAQRMRPDGEWFDFGSDSDPVAIIEEG